MDNGGRHRRFALAELEDRLERVIAAKRDVNLSHARHGVTLFRAFDPHRAFGDGLAFLVGASNVEDQLAFLDPLLAHGDFRRQDIVHRYAPVEAQRLLEDLRAGPGELCANSSGEQNAGAYRMRRECATGPRRLPSAHPVAGQHRHQLDVGGSKRARITCAIADCDLVEAPRGPVCHGATRTSLGGAAGRAAAQPAARKSSSAEGG